MVQLSLTMIVKNEAQDLARCLHSAKDLVDEIVIVDTGSTDETKAIALSFGARVFDYEWKHDFSDARNYALRQSTGDWNLVLDADEYILNDCRAQVREFIAAGRAVGRIKRIDKFEQNGEVMESQVFISRLFPRGAYYQGIIHEQVITDLPAVNTPIEVYHDGYFRRNKSDRNLKLLQEAVKEQPEDAYFLFQLAKEYRMAGNYAEADKHYTACYAHLKREEAYYPLVIVDYLYNVIAYKNFETGLDLIEREQDHLADYPDFHLACGHLMRELVFSDIERYIGYFGYIEQSFLACLALGETSRYDSVRGAGSFLPAYNLGVFYETSGDKDKARTYYALGAEAGYKPAAVRLAAL
ncbi:MULTISPECIES: tetratricopeptide repeat-containing glycosyltransferase family 2 protein [Paenibacillus]|uniref:tetratricopeptide repeat-containing glycosyltransferase family 2 protein n=1 Tax=Paenibacillus TaxID=44249 RepID=UPI0022B8B2E9|nr:glycosyltransferase family 2 protein [Paenibacillus caseinilyticus]MCZ8519841.1 glycosyltransferase family 2 protein [Paenibacillus caseinilyticus]